MAVGGYRPCAVRCLSAVSRRRPPAIERPNRGVRPPSWAPPRRASRRWPWRMARARPDARARVGRLDAGVPRHGHRHRQADRRPSRPRCPTTSRRRSTRGRTFTVAALPADRPGRRSPASRPAAAGPLLVGGTGLYLQAVVDELDDPGQFPEVRAELEAEPDTPRRSTRRLTELDPVAAGRMEPTNRRRIVRALEVTRRQRAALLQLRPGPRRPPADRASPWSARLPRDDARRTDRGALRRQIAAGFLDEVRRLLADPRRPVAHRRARPSATRSCSPTSPARSPSTRRSTWPCGAPAGSPAASGPGSAATPASAGCAPTTRGPRRPLVEARARW